MLSDYCICCNDKSRFNVKEGTLRNLERRFDNLIYTYLRKLNERDIKISDKIMRMVKSGVMCENNNVHMMCGHCPSIDNNSIRRLDESIHNSLAKICTILKDDRLGEDEKRKLFFESLRFFRGNYPISYRFLERYYHTEVKGK